MFQLLRPVKKEAHIIFDIKRVTELESKVSVFVSENKDEQLDMYAEAIAEVYDLRKENEVLAEMANRYEEKCKKMEKLFNTCWAFQKLNSLPESA